MILLSGVCTNLARSRNSALYHKCLKFFTYNRRDSVTSMLYDIGLPSFNTLLNNAQFAFYLYGFSCSNVLVRELYKMQISCYCS